MKSVSVRSFKWTFIIAPIMLLTQMVVHTSCRDQYTVTKHSRTAIILVRLFRIWGVIWNIYDSVLCVGIELRACSCIRKNLCLTRAKGLYFKMAPFTMIIVCAYSN